MTFLNSKRQYQPIHLCCVIRSLRVCYFQNVKNWLNWRATPLCAGLLATHNFTIQMNTPPVRDWGLWDWFLGGRKRRSFSDDWWTRRDVNPPPPHCAMAPPGVILPYFLIECTNDKLFFSSSKKLVILRRLFKCFDGRGLAKRKSGPPDIFATTSW